MVDAIAQRQGQRLWSLLSKYYPPSLLYDRQGDPVNPLMLALQAGDGGATRTAEGFSLLSILLDARCDPNILGDSRQSPLLYAIGIQDKDAVQDLLIARANTDIAPLGMEPPLCVAVRHRMGDIAQMLLTYHADVEARSQPTDSVSQFGPSATELAAAVRHLPDCLGRTPVGKRRSTTLKRLIKPSGLSHTRVVRTTVLLGGGFFLFHKASCSCHSQRGGYDHLLKIWKPWLALHR